MIQSPHEPTRTGEQTTVIEVVYNILSLHISRDIHAEGNDNLQQDNRHDRRQPQMNLAH